MTRRFKTLVPLLGTALLATATWAQTALPTAEAEVRRVDTRANTVTLRHGDIKNLDMPPMTMVFQVQNPALLQQVKAGDKVRFTADKVGGNYTVISLERAEGAGAPPAAPAAAGAPADSAAPASAHGPGHKH